MRWRERGSLWSCALGWRCICESPKSNWSSKPTPCRLRRPSPSRRGETQAHRLPARYVVNRLKRSLSAIFFIVGISTSLAAQNAQTQQNDSAERLRLQLAENARKEAEQRDWIAKIFEIKYADPTQLQRALTIFRAEVS